MYSSLLLEWANFNQIRQNRRFPRPLISGLPHRHVA